MAKSVVLDYKAKLDPNTPKTIGEVKKELNKLNKSLQETVQGSKEYNKILLQMADHRSTIQNLSKDLKSLDPGEKLAAIGNIAKGAIGAYTGLIGAVNTFSGANEDLQKQLLKVNAAMTMLQGAQQVMSTLDDGKRILGALTTGFTQSVKGMNAATLAVKGFGLALKAAGIGLATSAITYLVAKWEDIKKAVVDFIPWLGKTGEALDKLKAVAMGVGQAVVKFLLGPFNAVRKAIKGDFSGAVEEMKNSFDFIGNYVEGKRQEEVKQTEEHHKKLLSLEVSKTSKQIEILKARGRDTYRAERENLEKSLKLHREGSKEYEDILHKIALLDAAHTKKIQDEAQKQRDDRNKQFEDAKKLEEAFIKQAELQRMTAYQKELNDLREQYAKVKAEAIKAGIDLTAITEAYLSQLSQLNLKYNLQTVTQDTQALTSRLGAVDEFAPKIITASGITSRELTKIEQQRLEDETNIGKLLLANKESLVSSTSSMLKSAASIAGESTKTGKALAIAGATIDTYQSAVSAYKAMAGIPYVGPALGAVAAGAAVAAGLTNVAQIKRTSTNSTSVSSTGAPSYSAPKIPTTSVTTDLSSSTISNLTANQKPVEIKIGIDEITSTQNRVSSYETASAI